MSAEKAAHLAEVRLRPDPDVVECLEKALALARRGEIRSVAIAMVLEGKDGGSSYALDPKQPIFAVEVKTGQDEVRPHQVRTFHLLQEAGIPVFVWRPEDPRLLPWRQDKHPQRRKLMRKHRKARTRSETPRLSGQPGEAAYPPRRAATTS